MAELYLPKKRKRAYRPKIIWTDKMLYMLRKEFPFQYNKVLAKKLSISWRSLVRKARELGVDKEPDFLDKRRDEITAMVIKANPQQPTKGQKGFVIPNSEKYRFKPGNISSMKDPRVVKKARMSRNKTIAEEKLRIRYGLPQKTKLNLKNIY